MREKARTPGERAGRRSRRSARPISPTPSLLLALLPLACLLLAGCGLTPASTGAAGDLSAARPQQGDRSLTRPSPTPFLSTPTATATAALTSASAAVASATPAGPWLMLSPNSGPPGTVVTIAGFIPTSAAGAAGSASGRPNADVSYVNACWASCGPNGLLNRSLPVRWSADQPGRFSTQFTIPAVPWLGLDGPRTPAPGAYAITLQGLAPVFGPGPKDLGPALGATFHLTGPTPSQCRAGAACARLRLSPSAAPPGTLVQVQGWAPLVEESGLPGGALSYMLVVEPGHDALQLQSSSGQPSSFLGQAANGDLSGAFRVPMSVGLSHSLTPGAYTLALQTYRSAAPGQPEASVPGQALPDVATVLPVHNGGTLVSQRILQAPTVFTVTAAPTWASLGRFQPFWTAQTGGSLFADPNDARRLAYCGPDGVYVSADGGATWATIPVAAALADVRARYPQQGGPPPTACGDATLDPDHPQSFSVTFGLGVPLSAVVGYGTSDGGRTWSSPTWPGSVDVGHQGPAELVALSSSDVALLSADGQYPLRVSHDGGASWETVSLPSIPGMGASLPWDSAPQWLPSGDLLLTPTSGPARLLLTGAATWCSVASAILPEASRPEVIGTRLWWLQPEGNPITLLTPRSVPLDHLRCAAP